LTYTQIKADTTFWITGDSTVSVDFTAADMLVAHNEYLNEVVSHIMQADGRWEFDDNNLTTLPIATADIVSGQGDYEISAADFLDIIKVEMKDANGESTTLTPMSYNDKKGITITSLDETQGTPTMYDKVANSIILHTKPNYSSTAGLKVYFQRVPHPFVLADTTATPGFSPLYHRYLSYGAALDYCSINSMNDRASLLMAKMEDMRQRIKEDYSKRNKDENVVMSTRKEDYGTERYYSASEDKINW